MILNNKALKKIKGNPSYSFFLILAFLEGGSVMAAELFGAKILAPFFGTSIYVWACVLAVSLGGLAAGYYFGGITSVKHDNKKLLFYVFLLAGSFMLIMPYSSKFILEKTLDFSVFWGSLISLTFYLFPVLFFFGVTSPVIINLLSENNHLAGKNSGRVYGISTVGGIIITLLCGFWIIPVFGIVKPAILYGALWIIISLFFLIKNRSTAFFFTVLAALTLGWILTSFKNENYSTTKFKILHQEEGMLGQIKVLQHRFNINDESSPLCRSLLVNNTAQTILNLSDPNEGMWGYGTYLLKAFESMPTDSNILLLGLGGGYISRQLKREGFNVEAVELDERIYEVTKRYFFYPENISVTIADARRFLLQNNKKYQSIVFDTFHGESPPAHLLTVECMELAKTHLQPKGVLMINFYGYIKGTKGKISRCLYKTLKAAGYEVSIFATGKIESQRNLIFIAYDKSNLPKEIPIQWELLHPHLVEDVDLSDAEVLTDEIPKAEILSASAAAEWKKLYNEYFLKSFVQEDLKIIK